MKAGTTGPSAGPPQAGPSPLGGQRSGNAASVGAHDTSRRILFFADASSVHTRRWVQAMAERQFECFVATRRPATIAGAAEVIALQEGDGGLGWFRAIPQVRALARRIRPHWVHGHYVTSYGLWAAACGYPVPKVLTAWGSDILVTPREPGLRGSFMSGLVGWSLRQAQLVTADSSDVIEAIRGYGVKAPCHEVLWGADTDRFRPGKPAKPGFEIVSLRSWEPNYNIDVILHAFARLRRERPDAGAVLTLLGGGPLDRELHSLAIQLELGDDALRLIGRTDDTGMVEALQRAAVSVSVPSSDATSVAMLESMACGVAVVASDLPANRPWIDASLLVPAKDEAALARVLVRLCDDRSLVRSLGERNRRLVEQKGSRRGQMDRMAVLYESLWLRAPGPGAA